MIEVDRIIIGNGPVSNFYQALHKSDNTLIFDASFISHAVTELNKVERFSLDGTLHKWGGNLFFEKARLENIDGKLIQKFQTLLPNGSDCIKYESAQGFGFLLPKGFALEPKQFVVREEIIKIKRAGSKYVVVTNAQEFHCRKLVISTGKSTRFQLAEDGSAITLHPWDGVVYDKKMTIEFDDIDYGQISIDEKDGLVTTRYKLSNYGYAKLASLDFVKLVHLLNAQAPLKFAFNKSLFTMPLVVLQRLFKLESKAHLYLTTISKPQKGRNLLQFDPSETGAKHASDSHIRRALHTEIFQDASLIETLSDWQLAHDQFCDDDMSFAVGSVGNRLTRLLETSHV